MRPLHYAAWQGKEITTVSLLLKEGSSANEPAQNGTTPLHLACEHGHLSVVSMKIEISKYVHIQRTQCISKRAVQW